jgi:phage gp46-like protein
MSQQGDVLLVQTNDDGDITVTNGVVEMTGSFETASYLSLFGGNEDYNGVSDNNLTYWGDFLEVDPDFKYVSKTQNLLQALPAISANLLRIEEAAKSDLNWFLTKNVASTVTVVASIPALNRITITVTIEAQGEESTFSFTENWKAGVN